MKWITDGTKPTTTEFVLVCFQPNIEVWPAYWNPITQNWHLDDGPPQLPETVKAWMPMPEPPKGE